MRQLGLQPHFAAGVDEGSAGFAHFPGLCRVPCTAGECGVLILKRLI